METAYLTCRLRAKDQRMIECSSVDEAVKQRIGQLHGSAFYWSIVGGVYAPQSEIDSALERLVENREVVLQRTTWNRRWWKALFTQKRETLHHFPREAIHEDAFGERRTGETDVLYSFYLGSAIAANST